MISDNSGIIIRNESSSVYRRSIKWMCFYCSQYAPTRSSSVSCGELMNYFLFQPAVFEFPQVKINYLHQCSIQFASTSAWYFKCQQNPNTCPVWAQCSRISWWSWYQGRVTKDCLSFRSVCVIHLFQSPSSLYFEVCARWLETVHARLLHSRWSPAELSILVSSL